jgi:hypothetical protein
VVRAVDTVNRKKVVLAVGHERRIEPPIHDVMRAIRFK